MKNLDSRDWGQAIKAVFDEWAGCSVGARKVKLWGSERDVFQGSMGLRGRISEVLYNKRVVNAFNMSVRDMEEFVRFLNRWRPTLLLAYVESAYEVAKTIKANGWEIHPPGAIMTSAGTLFPDFRREIEDVFGCAVFDRYGTREVGDVACDCEHHAGLHVSVVTHVVEVLREDGSACQPGETGDLVITSLTNYAMPLIRYKIGDRATVTDAICPCGRGLPLMHSIEGRSTSVFRNLAGDIISPEYFIHLLGVVLNHKRLIKRFQVIQEELDLVIVKLVLDHTGENARDDLLTNIREKIQLVMGSTTLVEFAIVGEIAPSASGKYLYTVSKISEPKGEVAHNVIAEDKPEG